MANYFGLAYERFCHKNIDRVCEALGFGLEEIESIGPLFKQPGRLANKQKGVQGAQIDLLINIESLIGNNARGHRAASPSAELPKKARK